MGKPSLILATLLVACGLAACGGTGGGPAITDGSGNRVQIGGDTASVGGPGSPGWPRSPTAQR